MEGIFISYRREESAGHAGRIYDRLRERFGRDRVFMDVSAIEPGVDFVEAIDRAVGSCAVLLVIIGQRWLDCTDSGGRRRLDDPRDFIRLEVGTALRRNIRVVPVLVQDAAMPTDGELPDDLKLLARRNAFEINDSHWDSNMAQLEETLGRVLGETAGPAPPGGTWTTPAPAQRKNRLVWLISSITAIVVALAGLFTGVESLRNSVVRLFGGSPTVTTTNGTTAPPVGQGSQEPPPGGETQSPPEPDLVTVPDVVKQPLERAAKMLEEAGLRPGAETPRPTDRARPGTVLDQKIRGGTEARRGTAVDLLVAVPPYAGGTSEGANVIASGNRKIPQTYLFDLDSGKLVRDGEADLWFEAVTETERYLTPKNGATIGFTREKPSLEVCSTVRMAERRIPVQRIPEGAYACVRTSRGNLAAFKLLEPVGPSPGIMLIQFSTWERSD